MQQAILSAVRGGDYGDTAHISVTPALWDAAPPYYKSYDGMRHPLSITDRNGNVSTYTWDSYGNLLTGSYADSTSTSFAWDSLGRMTSASDSAAGTLTRTWSSVRTYIGKYSTGSVVKGTVQPVWNVNGLPLKMTVLGPDKGSE